MKRRKRRNIFSLLVDLVSPAVADIILLLLEESSGGCCLVSVATFSSFSIVKRCVMLLTYVMVIDKLFSSA